MKVRLFAASSRNNAEVFVKLIVTRNLWGVVEPWEESFPRMKGAGYQGIELSLPEADEQHQLRERLAQFEFTYIAQINTQGSSVEEHIVSFKQKMIEAKNLKPKVIVCLGGHDGWSETEADHFIREVLKIEEAVGLPVAHATHRGRLLYNPWRTARLMEKNTQLKLCCDYSHWVVVTERLLDDIAGILQETAKRCIHIHGRVGYEAGPQVSDPRAFEYQRHVEAHERWWEEIWKAQAAQGMEATSFTPDYGPPPYLHTLPHTNVPVASLSEICDWQAARAKERFAKLYGNGNGIA
jgi:sugar phosphate isomerase/epimerase